MEEDKLEWMIKAGISINAIGISAFLIMDDLHMFKGERRQMNMTDKGFFM